MSALLFVIGLYLSSEVPGPRALLGVQCITLTEGETTALKSFHARSHIVMCFGDDGSIGGVVLSRRGKERCRIEGFETGADGCVSLSVCDRVIETCSGS